MNPNTLLARHANPAQPAKKGFSFLVVDIGSRKVFSWDVEECEDAKLAAELLRRTCHKEPISRRCNQPLMFHADKGNALAAAFRAAIACGGD